MIAALRDLEIAVMARGQLDVLFGRLRDEVDKRPLARRRVLVHRFDDLFVLMRAGDREHLRVRGADGVGFLAHTTGDDDTAVLIDRFAYGSKALLLGAVEEAASVDQHHVCASVVGAHRIAVCAQASEDAFGIDQRLGAAERDHADALLVRERGGRVHMGRADTLSLVEAPEREPRSGEKGRGFPTRNCGVTIV